MKKYIKPIALVVAITPPQILADSNLNVDDNPTHEMLSKRNYLLFDSYDEEEDEY